jgi:hypothetical protein
MHNAINIRSHEMKFEKAGAGLPEFERLFI